MKKAQKVCMVLLLLVICTLTFNQDVKAASENPSEWLLYPAQNESSIEKTIAKWMKLEYDVEATYKFSEKDEDDLYLIYSYTPDNAPKILTFVDTYIVEKTKAINQVTKRSINIASFCKLPESAKTPTTINKIFELNNKWHQENKYPHRIYLDDDNDIMLESRIIIPGSNTPVHVEVVSYLIVQQLLLWEDYYSELKKVVTLPPS